MERLATGLMSNQPRKSRRGSLVEAQGIQEGVVVGEGVVEEG